MTAFLVAAVLAAASVGQGDAAPRELGDVRWNRDFERALAESSTSGRPVLILFDEVPGCSTCVGYGQTVLTDPRIVEAAETLFVPLAVYNNGDGPDAEALRAFGEPRWNNPVVRIVDAERRLLAPRLVGDYSRAGLLRAMLAALEQSGREVPAYLRLVAEEAEAKRRGTARAVLAAPCFWAEEACLGALDGVIDTRTGFLQGREVVEVAFDASRLSYTDLLREAKNRGCTSHVIARDADEQRRAREVFAEAVSVTDQAVDASSQDDKYHLARTPWRLVPMSPAQATRVNASLAAGRDPRHYLSPRQLDAFERQSP